MLAFALEQHSMRHVQKKFAATIVSTKVECTKYDLPCRQVIRALNYFFDQKLNLGLTLCI